MIEIMIIDVVIVLFFIFPVAPIAVPNVTVSWVRESLNNTSLQNKTAYSGGFFSHNLSMNGISMQNGMAKKHIIRKENLHPESMKSIIFFLSLAPSFFTITGFNAFNIVLENTIICPESWFATPCAAFAITPKKEFNTSETPCIVPILIIELKKFHPANEVISFINPLFQYGRGAITHSS